MRTCNARPYRFGGFLNIIPIEERFPIPTNLRKNGRRNASPTDKTSKFTTHLVGTGVPDGPKRADMESAPTDKHKNSHLFCRGRHPWRPVCSTQCYHKPSPVGEGAEERGG